MAQAVLFGVIASAGLAAGSLVGTQFAIPERVLALMLAFASGALITALAFEMFEDAYRKSGGWVAGIAFVVGAAVFVAVSWWLDRRVERAGAGPAPNKLDKDIATPGRAPVAPSAAGATGFALLAAATLDGVPENVALGVTLGEETGSATLLIAIFTANIPEGLVGAAALRTSGRTRRFAAGVWLAAAVLLVLAVVAGELLPSDPDIASIPLAFAGGAVIASLADTFMPEAFEGGGPLVAFATTGGFLLSYVFSTL